MHYPSLIVPTDSFSQEELLAKLGLPPEPHPDVLWIQPKEGKASISIEQIHTLVSQASLSPFSRDYKVFLIAPAEVITLPAQQALLKTLEEPPQNTQIILITGAPQKLLPTIRSRCQVMSIKILGSVHKDQKISISELQEIVTGKYSVGKSIQFVKDQGATKEDAIEVVSAILQQLRTLPPTKSTILHQQHCLQALEYLTAQVNAKLVVEDLLFALSST